MVFFAVQINQMIAFIEQEASEKVEEIDAKADEEFNIEKGKLVQQQRVKIMEFYERKEKQIELQRKIQNSSLQNQARLRVLKTQEDFVLTTIETAKKRLSLISGDAEKYRQVLQLLLLQALEQLLEPDVLIICRKKDVSVLQSMVDPCVSAYRKATKREIKVNIDHERHLPDDVYVFCVNDYRTFSWCNSGFCFPSEAIYLTPLALFSCLSRLSVKSSGKQMPF